MKFLLIILLSSCSYHYAVTPGKIAVIKGRVHVQSTGKPITITTDTVFNGYLIIRN